MNGIIGEFRLGEDIAVALDATAGDPASVSAISAKMKPAKVLGNRLALDDNASPVDLNGTAAGAEGWLISLDHTASASLAPGIYGIDARLTIAGGVEITEQTAFIALSRAAVA
ncbi:MAG: hypothetical protein AB7F98_02555 [Novosphingobium sp.]